MKTAIAIACLVSLTLASSLLASDIVILHDNFDREEQDQSKEQIGNNWGTNSRTRAQGQKQVDLVEGAMHITRAAVADHGVSVTHEVAFKDATIQLRFKLGPKDDLGINIADMKEKSVHAGHLCVARIKPQQLEISDLKTGVMNLKTREKRLANTLTAQEQQQLKTKAKRFPVDLAVDTWHDLEVKILGDQMTVSINGKLAGQFQSDGIDHATKSRLRLAVNKSAWVDDVKVTRHE